MLQYNDAHNIALDVFAKLGVPDKMDSATAEMLNKKYLQDDATIMSLVEAELANYDTLDNLPADIDDIIDNASDVVFFMLDDAINDYYRGVDEYNTGLINNAYYQIIEAIRNADIEGVKDIHTEYEPADSSVGLYRDERTIIVELTNGASITMSVEFDE